LAEYSSSAYLTDTKVSRLTWIPVFSATILTALCLRPGVTHDRLGGVGGVVNAVVVETQVRFNHEEAGKVVFRGQFAAVTELEALDMSVLGRDITGLFAVIVDRPHDIVCLLGQRHQYMIEQD
jgi:hypothetical protein